VETRGGRIACVGFGWSDLDALCVPLMHADGRRYWGEDMERDEFEICYLIRILMEHESVRLIGQNFNYDRQYFVRDPAFGFRPRLHYDTMIGHHLLFPGTPKDLATQSSLYCQWHCFWKDEGKEIDSGNEAQWWEYNCRDCVATWEIARVTRPLLVKAGFAREGL
jgi:DNA polymerase I-like protein with 3'-5' exonuclease and polymerase domains